MASVKQTATLIIVSSLMLSACSSMQERRIASGNFDYLDIKNDTKLAVPPELNAPEQRDEYIIPAVSSNAPVVYGEQLPVVSPALVLPTAQGTFLQESEMQTAAIFDKLDNSQNIREFVLTRIENHLVTLGLDFSAPDPSLSEIVTDWQITQEDGDSPWYAFGMGGDTVEVGKRYKINVEPASHGRTARVVVQLTDLVIAQGDDLSDSIDPFIKRELESELLNGIIRQYSLEQKVENQNRIAQLRSGINADLGFDDDGNGAIVLDTQYDIAWPKLQLVLRTLGFNVKDLDKSNGLLFVDYQGKDVSWMDSFLGGDDSLALAKDDYRIQVKRLSENKTSITFMDEQSVPFKADAVADIFPTIAETFERDNLDI